jgi:hypothetical protein
MDKYLVAVMAIVRYLNCLSELGLSPENLSLLVSWSRTVDVTMRLKVDKRCTYVKESKREVEVGFSLTNNKVITTVTE